MKWSFTEILFLEICIFSPEHTIREEDVPKFKPTFHTHQSFFPQASREISRDEKVSKILKQRTKTFDPFNFPHPASNCTETHQQTFAVKKPQHFCLPLLWHSLSPNQIRNDQECILVRFRTPSNHHSACVIVSWALFVGPLFLVVWAVLRLNPGGMCALTQPPISKTYGKRVKQL